MTAVWKSSDIARASAWRGGRQANPERDALIRKIVRAGGTRLDVQAQTGLGETGTRKAIYRLGLTPRPVDHHPNGQSRNPERDERIRTLAATGLTASRIAAEVGVTPHVVESTAKRLGLTLTKRFRRKPEAITRDMQRAHQAALRESIPALILENDIAEAVTLAEANRSAAYIADHLGWDRSRDDSAHPASDEACRGASAGRCRAAFGSDLINALLRHPPQRPAIRAVPDAVEPAKCCSTDRGGLPVRQHRVGQRLNDPPQHKQQPAPVLRLGRALGHACLSPSSHRGEQQEGRATCCLSQTRACRCVALTKIWPR